MQGIVSLWQSLPVTKRIMLVGAVALTVTMVSMLAKTASKPDMALLYSGLDTRAAGEVIAALEKLGVDTDIRGDAIYVPARRRDTLRMSLARDGLPQQGQAGYELLEDLNGFSTTSEIFDVAYWRAKEGELARTIIATPGVSAARVHIAQSRSGPFVRNGPAPKAVVTVTMGRGALSSSQAQSIRYLVSSSVPGLSAEQVAVLDSDKGVILSPGSLETATGDQSEAIDREGRLEADLVNLLEARVGEGNARVQIAMELDMEREAVTERVFDPAGKVLSGKETTEISEKSIGASNNSVGVSSNLPEGDESASKSTTERTQTDETVSYDVSEIRREREKAPGAIKRLSVAVLVNSIQDAENDGEITPRSEEELNSIRELVSMAVGLNEARGDTLTVQSLPFRPTASSEGIVVEKSLMDDFISRHLMTVIQVGVLGIVSLVLGLFVVKPLLNSAAEAASSAPAQVAAAEPARPAEMLEQASNPFEQLRGLANERTDETATLIKSWLEEENAA